MVTHDEELSLRHHDRPERVRVVLEYVRLDLRDTVDQHPALRVTTLHRVARQPNDSLDDVLLATDHLDPVTGGLEDDDVAVVNAVQLVRQLVDENAVVVAA